MAYQIIVQPSDEGGYLVFSPSLPGCVCEGDTRDEAIAQFNQQISRYVDTHGNRIK